MSSIQLLYPYMIYFFFFYKAMSSSRSTSVTVPAPTSALSVPTADIVGEQKTLTGPGPSNVSKRVLQAQVKWERKLFFFHPHFAVPAYPQ